MMSLACQDPDSTSPPPPPPPRSFGDDNEPEEKYDEDKDSTYQPPKGSSFRSGRGGQGSDRGDAGKKGGNSNTSRRNQFYTKGKQRATGNEQTKTGVRLEKFDWDSFDVIDVLGDGRSGTVFEATLRGERVAFELCDLWQHPEYHKVMLTEAKAYMALEQLQGPTIPKFKGARYTAGGTLCTCDGDCRLPWNWKN